MDPARQLGVLERVLDDLGAVAVATSGGVDSMTLAHVAAGCRGAAATMHHAVSPAVPPSATARVRRHASSQGWTLRLVDAGEFSDERYLANPANRCFFCKTHLYGSLARLLEGVPSTLISGTNTDDLGDWRPGLAAARDHGVRHPFVEAGIDKAGVRAIARHLGLDDLAELPAAPCLSSRIETGIRIEAPTLLAIDSAETLLRNRLAPSTVRLRVRADRIAVELDPPTLESLGTAMRAILGRELRALFGHHRHVAFEPYSRGSAFLREQS